MAPREPQEGPRRPPNCPKTAAKRPKMASMGAQERPKITPRRLRGLRACAMTSPTRDLEAWFGVVCFLPLGMMACGMCSRVHGLEGVCFS